MSLQISSTNLTKALSSVAKFSSTKQQNYILNNIVFESNKEGIILKATDLETSIIMQLDNAKNETFDNFAISGKDLLGFVSSLPIVDIKFEIKEHKIQLITDSATAEFSTINPTEFPNFTKSESKELLTLSRREVEKIVSQVSVAVSNDSTRAALTGICIEKAERLQIVAVDGFRLGKLEFEKNTNLNRAILIQPKIFVESLNLDFEEATLHALRNQTEEVVQIELRCGNTSYFARIIDATFPDYKSVIPSGELSNKFKFDKNEMLQNLKIVNNIAKNLLGQKTILKLSGQELKISATDNEKGTIETSMLVENNGNNDMSAAFNIKYLQDALKTFSSDDVVFQSKSGSSPALFTSEEAEHLHVVMPMRVD